MADNGAIDLNQSMIDRKEPVKEERFQTGKAVTISLAHSVHDTYIAFIAPLLPILIENFSLTRTMAGALTIFTRLPSLFQPFIGHIADRIDLRPLVILAPGITGILVSLIGITPHYIIIALLLTLAGFSSAALHAVGPAMIANISGKRLGQGVSFWMVGGELSGVLGPIVIVTALGYLTLQGIPWLMIGGILVSILLYFRLRNADGLSIKASNGASFWSAVRSMKALFLPLTLLVIVTSFMYGALSTYLPMLLTDEGANLWFAGASLSVLEAAGIAGVLMAGMFSDRIGRRVIIMISLIASPVFMLIFLSARGWLQFPILLFLGFFSLSIFPVLMAVVQESFPENRALANGTFLMLDFVIRSIMVVIIGLVGDAFGLRLAFYISAALMLLGIPAAFLLPLRKPA